MASSRTSSVGLSLGVGIFVLTVATAVIHLYLALSAIGSMGFNFGVMLFILNGLGYLGLLAVLQLPIRQLALPGARDRPYSLHAAAIVLFFVMAPVYTIIGYVDKAIEVALIALLLADAVHGVLLAFWRDP